MSVTPVDSSVVPTQSSEASFDDAIVNAQQNSPEDQAQMDEVMLKGVMGIAQTLLMPRMNEILSEAQSDE